MDQVDQLKEIKKDKHLLRMQKDSVDVLLQPFRMNKIWQTCSEIWSKERKRSSGHKQKKKRLLEIQEYSLMIIHQDLDKKQLTAVERERKKELEKLSVERENLRVREQQMLEEVKKMEQQLLEQEKFFRKQREAADRDPNREFATNDIRQKELNMARERGERIVQIKAQRDRLEKERGRIMDDLENVKSGNYNPIRRNESARILGDQYINGNERYNQIEPSLKDKFVNDTVKINYLREQRKKTMNEMMPEIDELDILQKELENRNYVSDANNLANEYDGRMTPNKAVYLGAIRNKIENQAAAPSSYLSNHNNYINQQDPYDQEFPSHVPQGEGKKVMISNLKSIKDDYLTKGGEDTDFISKVNDLENFLLYKKQLPQPDHRKLAPGNQSTNEIQISQQPPPFLPPPGYPPGAFPPTGFPPGAFPPPPFGGFPGGMMGGPPGQPGFMPPYFDPMMQQMNMMMQQQEMENQKLREALQDFGNANGGAGTDFDNIINSTNKELDLLKNQILPGGGLNGQMDEEDPLPEDFVFRQNEFRSEDLEVEERALMNITAQEYDQLRVISKLPVNSELYRYKMDQYKEISTMRAEVMKVLEEQRLEKIRRDFEKQKYEDERRFKHEKWLEDQKRQILEAKLKNAGGRSQAQEDEEEIMESGTQQQSRGGYRRPGTDQPLQTQQSQNEQTPKSQKDQVQKYDPNTGFILCIDHLFNCPREHKQIRLVYSVFQDKKSLVEPRLIEMKSSEADFDNNPIFNKVFFNSQHVLKHVKQHPSANLIIELQVPDPNKTAGFASYGWTMLNVFDASYNLNKGRWRLPLYRPPTILDLDTRDIYKLKPLLTLLQCIRIAMPKDEVFNFQPNNNTKPNFYNLPYIHQIKREPGQQAQPPPPQSKKSNIRQPQMNDPMPIQQRDNNNEFVQPPYQNLGERNNKYEVNGIELVVHYVHNIKSYMKCKVQATLYEGVSIVKQDNREEMNWASNSVDKSEQLVAPKGSRIEIGLDGKMQIYKPPAEELSRPREYGYNQIGQAGLDEFVLPIQQGTSWQRDLYSMIWDHHMKDNLYLLLQVFIIVPVSQNQQRLPNQPPLTQNYEPVGYAVFQVNNQDGTIRFGTYENTIYRMPINLFKQDESNATPIRIKFTLNQPRMQPLSVAQQLPSRGIDSKGRPFSTQFIPNFDKQWTPNEQWEEGDGIDVYIDWARHLPDNATFSKVFVTAIDASLQQVGQAQRGFASVEFSTGRNPFFGFKYEIRQQRMNPTLMVFVSFETIDRSNKQARFAGHSFFPLFMDKDNKMPIVDSQARNFTIHKGFYQMPVYCQHPNRTSPFTYENFIYMERIPTSSMLIRVYKAPKKPDGSVMSLENTPPERWAESGVLVQAPVYQDGIYNTQYFQNSALENKLFIIRKGRKDPPMSKALDTMLALMGQNPNMPEDKKLEIADKLITLQSNSPMIDMNFFSQYHKDIGFRVGVEAIHGNLEVALFSVLMSICPEATFYDPKRVGGAVDLIPFTGLDWSSHTGTMKFNEGQFMVQSIQSSKSAALIFDIKKFVIGSKKFEDYGFAVFPLFDYLETDDDTSTSEFYINSGVYSLPVYRGYMESQIINQLKGGKEVTPVCNTLRKLKVINPIPAVSIIIKVVDNQREKHLEQGFEQRRPSNKFLPSDLVSTLEYKPLDAAKMKKTKVLQTLIPQGENMTTFSQFLSDYIHAQYKI